MLMHWMLGCTLCVVLGDKWFGFFYMLGANKN